MNRRVHEPGPNSSVPRFVGSSARTPQGSALNRVPILLAVMGPTASGKTPLAEAVADRFDAQLINADAFQVYRGFDIGTAKPEHRDRYLLLDIREPQEVFGVGEFVQLAQSHLQ